MLQSAKKTPKTDKTPAQKKKPGRPRKNPIREHGIRHGISASPHDPENQVEFVYDEPTIFKKIWNYTKSMAIESLQIIFRPTEVIIYGEDHSQKSQVRVCLNAKQLNHYYCSESIECGIFNKVVEPIMSAIDETYNKLIINVETKNARKSFKIILSNDIEIDEERRVELIANYPKIADEERFLDGDYTLKFDLPGKYFKKMLSNVRLFSDQITIRQDSPTDYLMFEYKNTLKRICSKNVVKNNKKIRLQSALSEGETFHLNFKIDYIKPISTALATETIAIWAHETKSLAFIVALDNGTAEVKILTDLSTTKGSAI